MAVTTLTEVTNQIQKWWAPVFTKQLRQSLLLPGLVNKQYQGQIQRQGDTVRVSQVNAPTGQLLTVGTNAESFSTEAVSTSYVDIVANRRAVAAYEFQDLAELQSQIQANSPEVMNALVYAMEKQLNDYCFSLVSPSTSSPDHSISGVTDFNKTQLAACRVLAGQAKWPKDNQWYGLLDPQYYGDQMADTTLMSRDFGADDAPMIAGQIALKRLGFQLLEDNSRSADYGLLFHPDFMHLVMQQEAQVKVSDLHAQKKFGFVLSVDIVFGAKLGIDGDEKHIKVYNS